MTEMRQKHTPSIPPMIILVNKIVKANQTVRKPPPSSSLTADNGAKNYADVRKLIPKSNK